MLPVVPTLKSPSGSNGIDTYGLSSKAGLMSWREVEEFMK